MKLLVSCLAAILAIGGAKATTISLAGGVAGLMFTTSEGQTLQPMAGVSLQVGRLNTTTGVFTQFAPTDATPPSFGTTGNLAGRWLGNASDNTAAADAFNGAQMWFRVGFFGSVSYFTGPSALFPTNASGAGDTLTFSSIGLTQFSLEWSSPGTAITNNQAIVPATPEPSALLLGVLGMVGLLRRRR
ncbi:PEP-CTERM sorting domain-containing protein [Luteolibacter sp. Populi]|uniref:PEP-CTERM sorting domain-containing protein n=1 Tax=Luteolibacter sp. Populi TaxID=3230487 RepID=UPI003465A5A3